MLDGEQYRHEELIRVCQALIPSLYCVMVYMIECNLWCHNLLQLRNC